MANILAQRPGRQLQEIISRGELRISTLNSPLTYFNTKQGPGGLDYELAKRFANYLGVKLVVIPHQNINDLFDDLDDDDADLLAAGLIYNQERLSARTGPAYYSVSQQLVYRLGTPQPKSFADIKGKLAVASGSAHVSTLKQLKQDKYPDLAGSPPAISPQRAAGASGRRQAGLHLGDSVTIALLQRIHPQLAVAFDVTDEEPVTWYLKRDGDDSLYAAMLDFYSQMVDDGTGAARRNTSATSAASTMWTPKPSCRPSTRCCPTSARCSRSTPTRSTGSCWRRSPIRNRTGIRRPPHPPACAA
ncbi:transporter substrate-binding domain-containing protein [Serratia ureilytica]